MARSPLVIAKVKLVVAFVSVTVSAENVRLGRPRPLSEETRHIGPSQLKPAPKKGSNRAPGLSWRVKPSVPERFAMMLLEESRSMNCQASETVCVSTTLAALKPAASTLPRTVRQ